MKNNEERAPDRLLKLLAEIQGKAKIELLLLFLQEMGGQLQHLNSIGSAWGADVKEDRVAQSMEYYLQKVEEIKFLILQEYERPKPKI